MNGLCVVQGQRAVTLPINPQTHCLFFSPSSPTITNMTAIVDLTLSPVISPTVINSNNSSGAGDDEGDGKRPTGPSNAHYIEDDASGPTIDDFIETRKSLST
jgi:hypothetical protein